MVVRNPSINAITDICERKTIFAIFLISIVIGGIVVKYCLLHGQHVPTNDELIISTKAAIAARKNTKPAEQKKVTANQIKRLRKEK